MKNLTHVLALEPDATDKEIVEIIRQYDRIMVEREYEDGYQLTVNGYTDDPRELHEIPEAVDLLRRFVALGGIGLLTGSTHTDLRDKQRPVLSLGLGAMEVWGIAKGHIRGVGQVELPLEPFLRDYEQSLVEYQCVVQATAA